LHLGIKDCQVRPFWGGLAGNAEGITLAHQIGQGVVPPAAERVEMLEEKIFNDYKQALKNKETIRSSTLSFLRSEIGNALIEKRKKNLDDAEVISIIKKQIKQHQDSIEQFKKGNRQDLVDKETRELEILKSYLPEELSVEEVKKIVEEAIRETQAAEPKDMGKVMKVVLAKIAGKADGKLVSELVKARLSAPV